MGNTLRMYNIFFPRKWVMWFTYILYPIMLIVVCSFFLKLSLLVGLVIGLSMSTAGIVIVEYLLDVYMLFGIAAKDNKALEYVKSSAKGVHLLQRALFVDGIRRILTTALIMLGLYLAAWMAFTRAPSEVVYEVDGEVMSHPAGIGFLQCGVIAVLFTELGMLITRRIKNVGIGLVVLYLASGIACPLAMVATEAASVISVILSAALLVVVMVVSRKILVKKVRENYYDEGYKELLQTT